MRVDDVGKTIDDFKSGDIGLHLNRVNQLSISEN